MKGVILRINPQARLVDITHALSHHHLLEAAFVLQSAYAYFPEGTIHLVVVDPGVGGERRLIGIQGKEGTWVGPDNGLFTLVLKNHSEAKVVHLNNPHFFLPNLSQTFHGRDMLAPVAAHLGLGIPLGEMGSPISNPVLLSVPKLELKKNEIIGQVLWADHFGNLITNIDQKILSNLFPNASFKIVVGSETITATHQHYAQGRPGRLMALIGSSGYLEIACNLGSAAEIVDFESGLELKVRVIREKSSRKSEGLARPLVPSHSIDG
jgi:S-adenosyl-L-methionine hydrolase (adenosine-forming)